MMDELVERPKTVREIEEEKGSWTDTEYNQLAEMNLIVVANGFISFFSHFKYLVLWISFSYIDDYDVGRRIGMANVLIGALARFWDDHHIDMYSKYTIFRAIPCNLLLWGCESWYILATLLDKIEVFIHRGIRRILGIKMGQVRERHI